MKKQKQPVDRDLVDRSFFARVEPFLYLLPFLIGIAVFTLYPVINVVLMSFKEGYSYLSRGFDQWGLANYQTVLSDPKFSQAIGNTLKYVILVVPISTCIAVVVAYLLNQKLRFSAVFQTAYFLPMVTSITAVGLAWKLMYNKNFGIINYLLSFFGVNPIPWLEKASYSIPALVIFGIWNILPFTIILLLSGLQNIDPQYYTAARVDGSAACTDDLSGLHREHDFLLQGLFGAVSAVQRQTRPVQQPVYGGLLHSLRDDGKPQIRHCGCRGAGAVPVYLCVYHGAAPAAKENQEEVSR